MEILIGIIVALGGGSGIVTVWKAVTDHKNKVASREEEAEERLVKRLEAKAIEADIKMTGMQKQLDDANAYILLLSIALSRSGIEIPHRKA